MMEPNIIKNTNTIEGCQFIEDFKFDRGHVAPLYEISTTGAFNQIIGYAKFQNALYGNVYYRGVSDIFPNVLPSIMRHRTKGIPKDLHSIMNKMAESDYYIDSLKLISKGDFELDIKTTIRYNKHIIEGLLQHYIGFTRFLDVVDNHWVALWMGNHRFIMHGRGKRFCDCVNRDLSVGTIYENIANNVNLDKNLYNYILLIAMPFADRLPIRGIVETENFIEIDLRQALPSIYLRPHAQHALVIRRRDIEKYQNDAKYYDMASQVVAILRIRIDNANLWLGDGQFLKKENLFPSPSIDQGYNNLLMQNQTFTHPFEIIKYF